MKFSTNPLVLATVIRHRDWDDREAVLKWEAVLNHLKEHPGDATVKGKENRLPLHWAVFYAPFEVIKELVRIYPNSINAKDNCGNLPLHAWLRDMRGDLRLNKYLSCCKDQSLECFKLLRNEAAVRAADNNGFLPLHNACRNKYMNLGVLKSLLDDYPEAVVAVDGTGRTPLHYACKIWTSKQSGSFHELLSRKQFSRRAALMKDKDGKCPLQFACKNFEFSVEMVQQLMELNPAALEIVDNEGNLPKIHPWLVEMTNNKKDIKSSMEEMTILASGAVLDLRVAEASLADEHARIQNLEKENRSMQSKLDAASKRIRRLEAENQFLWTKSACIEIAVSMCKVFYSSSKNIIVGFFGGSAAVIE